ncbi:MAG: hypothetical protein AB1716_03060 [Planctomycetota bacterium]
MIPWIEVAPNRQALAQAIEGLRIWQQVTDTAIVLVDRYDSAALVRIREQLPDARLIPSIRTSTFLRGQFDRVEGWHAIGVRAQEHCRLTGSKRVVLESESALARYMSGDYQMNWDKLREGLEMLPKDILFLWYPAAAGPTRERYAEVCRCAQEAANVQLVDHLTLGMPGNVGSQRAAEGRKALTALGRRNPIMVIYCYGDKYWPFERIPEALGLADGEEVILYPGAARWVAAAQAMARLLPPFERGADGISSPPAATAPSIPEKPAHAADAGR